ncbi:hypothetical protein BO99DRAFT_433403 [Aspergillus violaceofuscus CBS 115571]|uniref:Uncharacterized protein n=1 Tax=Aspergillus violaceofuscus (strain CBS 115571) TaxID=1450538 RepID=A0A2V5HBY5_ASPV1|nr:hypothetical protein BO99DRAFT_433403 [Aspergillus violaceofuscus CBS 115571]
MILDLLQSFVEISQDPAINAFLHDARRFILSNSKLADLAPLQIYSSGLIFIPKSSIIRNRVSADISSWIRGTPMFEESWGPGISLLIRSMMLSPDGRRVAFELDDNTIRVWDAKDAQFERTFVGTHAAWASRTALIHVYESEWLCVNGEKILWLPPQQRAAALAYKKGTLVIVHGSGKFSMISCLI